MTIPDERFTGEDAIIKVPQGNEIAVSNVSWDREVNSTEVQHNDSLNPTHAITGLRYSGSFEYDGKNEDLRSQLWRSDGRPVRFTMTVKEEPGQTTDGYGTTASDPASRKFTFENVIVTSMSRDIPGDDVASTSWDFVAENVEVSEQ